MALSSAIEYTRLELSRIKPAFRARQYSRVFSVPRRLCSTSWRLLDRPSTPASKLGFAAASMTHSTAWHRFRVAGLTDSAVDCLNTASIEVQAGLFTPLAEPVSHHAYHDP